MKINNKIPNKVIENKDGRLKMIKMYCTSF